MFRTIAVELKKHAPFTILGALSGMVVMLFSWAIPTGLSYTLFFTFHPLHVLLSSVTTASLYMAHQCRGDRRKCSFPKILLIGYLGSVGIATLSDSVIPFWGETLLQLANPQVHMGFIEKWWLVNPLALLGVAIAYFRPTTKLAHAGHVLLSTWASLFHIILAVGTGSSWSVMAPLFVFLFLAVWIPCCTSDIIFPLLFLRPKKAIAAKQ